MTKQVHIVIKLLDRTMSTDTFIIWGKRHGDDDNIDDDDEEVLYRRKLDYDYGKSYHTMIIRIGLRTL